MRMFVVLSLALLASCGPSEEDMKGTRGGRLDVFFNDPGTRLANMWEPDVINVMIEMIDGANATIDFAVMGFGRDEVIDAFIRAHDRGVKVRMVGDAGHLYNSGYMRFQDRHIPMVVGNLNHIMHHKFMVVDDRFVFGGTANWTNTDLRHNSNNFFVIDNPHVADDFSAEFTQMFEGAFGHSKVEIDNGRTYTVGDTEVEVWFSPNEDSLGRILELVDASEESVKFCIFAFTKDQVGSAFIRAQERGVEVAGVIDQSQLHSNQQYHEVYRLLSAGIPLRMDGNDNGLQPGDYQAGGGRLHSKTIVIDANGENPVVVTGSFNWSSSATLSNDEFLIVMHGKRVADAYIDYWDSLWDDGRRMGQDWIGEDGIEPGDIVVNEVMWYGLHPEDSDGLDEFIELRNTSDRDIRLDLWQLSNPDDFVVGFPPGAVIPAKGLFTILDHTLEVYQDGAPQDGLSAYTTGDLVLNAYNDNRQSRLYLKDGVMELILRDPDANVMDVAGNGGAAPAGGPDNGKVYSMERRSDPGDGTDPDNWYTCTNEEGGTNVNETFKPLIVATPGEENSPEP